MRTDPRVGWRRGIGTALAVVVGQPQLWLIGALGFTGRGGVLLLALPIFIVPTPIEVRAMLGSNLGSSGLTASFYASLPVLAVAGMALLTASLLLAAHAELSAFERLVHDPETAEERRGIEPQPVGGADRRRLVGWLFLVQAGALVGLGLAAIPLAMRLGEVTLQELLRPTPGGDPLYLRVLQGVREPLFLLLPALVLVEMVTAGVSRRILVRAFGLTPDTDRRRGRLGALVAAASRPLRHQLRTLGTALAVWATSAVVLLPAVWALDVAWDATRATYLAPRATTDPQLIPGLLLMAVLLAGVWTAAILLAGFASALRAGLWSVESLR